MKYNVATREIESSPSIKVKKVGMKANAKAFSLLFSQIYPDIVKAAVRELIANAWDAQKAADNLESPIQIHLPTAWEPYFSVRDFGTSMTEEIVDEVYSNMFESSKDDSDDEVGQFGIGSKTPLGVSDAFSVQCWLDGETRIYNIFIGEDSTPMIALQYQGPSDEPNGVLVSFAVKQDDFVKFKEYVEVFAFGVPSPVEINGTKYYNEIIPVHSGEGWQIVNSDKIQGPHLRMGCILYKIRPEYLRTHNQYVRVPIILDFPIGSFKVTGSREDIVYNNEANHLIGVTFDEVKETITENIQEKINLEKTFRAASDLYDKTVRELNLTNVLTKTDLKWKSRKLHNLHTTFYKKSSRKLNMYYASSKSYYGDVESIRVKTVDHISVHNRDRELIVAFETGLKNYKPRIKTFLNEKKKTSCHVIEFGKLDSFTFRRFAAFFDLKTIPNLADYEPKKPTKREIAKLEGLFLRTFDANGISRCSREFIEGESSEYFIFDDGTTTGENVAIAQLVNVDLPIQVMTENKLAYVTKKYPNIKWKNLKDEFDTIRNDPNFIDEKRVIKNILSGNDFRYSVVRNLYEIIKGHDYVKIEPYDANLLQISEFADKLNDINVKLKQELEELKVKYPLIQYFDPYAINYSEREAAKKHLKEYVDLIDKG